MGERLTEGVLLKVDKTTVPGATYADIAEVTSIDGPNATRTAHDRTKLGTIGARRFRPGRKDSGEVSLEFTFDPDDPNHLWLAAQIDAKANRAWRIVLPKEEPADKDFYIDFLGFVVDFGTAEGGEDEFITASVTIKVDGDVTYAFAA